MRVAQLGRNGREYGYSEETVACTIRAQPGSVAVTTSVIFHVTNVIGLPNAVVVQEDITVHFWRGSPSCLSAIAGLSAFLSPASFPCRALRPAFLSKIHVCRPGARSFATLFFRPVCCATVSSANEGAGDEEAGVVVERSNIFMAELVAVEPAWCGEGCTLVCA